MCPVRVDILGSIVNQDKENGRHWNHRPSYCLGEMEKAQKWKMKKKKKKMFESEANTMIADT